MSKFSKLLENSQPLFGLASNPLGPRREGAGEEAGGDLASLALACASFASVHAEEKSEGSQRNQSRLLVCRPKTSVVQAFLQKVPKRRCPFGDLLQKPRGNARLSFGGCVHQ